MAPRFINRYRHLFPSVLLGGGFFIDIFTFRTLQPETTFAILGAYAFAAAVGVGLGESGAGPLRKVVPLMVQFTFGALLSAAFLFYWFGGSVAASWPVMLATVGLMAFNERFRHLFLRPAVQFGVFVFTFFSYCTLLFPYLLRSVSAVVFVLGGTVATVGSLVVAEVMARTDATRRPLLQLFRKIAVGTYAAFLALYFLNVIPPIPLSIRDAGIYNDVTVTGGEYVLEGATENVVQKLWPGQTVYLSDDTDGRIYAYTAIFAPTDLATTIVHRWQRYDEDAGRWVNAGMGSSYVTRGGRAEGYRGYSYRTIRDAGRWRVLIETVRGQELGRLWFTVVR